MKCLNGITGKYALNRRCVRFRCKTDVSMPWTFSDLYWRRICGSQWKKKTYFAMVYVSFPIWSKSAKLLAVKPEQERFLLLHFIGNCLLYSRFDNTIRKNQIRHQSNVCIPNCRSICCTVEIFISQFLDCLFVCLRKSIFLAQKMLSHSDNLSLKTLNFEKDCKTLDTPLD